MKVLELFAGTRSIGKAFEARGHEVYSVEWNKNFENIDLYADIGEITAQQILKDFGHPDVVWASPDCTSFSISAISHHRTKNPETGNLDPISDYAKFCDRVDQHVLDLIKELKPKYYFIENPRGGLRKMTWMQDMPRYTVTYCQYADPYIKNLIFNMKTKKCPICGKIKSIEDFYLDIEKRDNFSCICKSCSSLDVNEYKQQKEQPLENKICAYCGKPLTEENSILDTILLPTKKPINYDSNNNKIYICKDCHQSKNNKDEKDWLKKERCKPTDIWTNHPNPQFLPMCHRGDPCHEAAPRGSKTGTQGLKGAKERSVIPPKLCEHIAEICEQ